MDPSPPWRRRLGLSQDEEIENINKKKMEAMMQKQNDLRASQAQSPGEPVVLTDSTFSSEVSKHQLVVVDFWAAWCGPCRMVAPIVEQLAKEYAGRVTFGKLNVDENPEISQKFGIQSIPTMIVFKNGKAVDGLIGALPKAQIENKFRSYL
jgi:thioredoxin 1